MPVYIYESYRRPYWYGFNAAFCNAGGPEYKIIDRTTRGFKIATDGPLSEELQEQFELRPSDGRA